jgi:hypothetical protein
MLLLSVLVSARIVVAAAASSQTRSGAENKVLNNLVTELLRGATPSLPATGEWRLVNPRDGWVFISTSATIQGQGKAWITLKKTGKDKASGAGQKGESNVSIVHDQPGATTTRETMRFMAAGEYRLSFGSEGKAVLESLVVRAIPELIFCKFGYDPLVAPDGPYNWTFLQKHVLPHVNCIVGSGGPEQRTAAEAWKRQGKRWLVECAVPGLDGAATVSADQAYHFWAHNPGMAEPLLDGVIADEFADRKLGAKYTAWGEAVRKIRATERFQAKQFYPYCTSLYGDPLSEEFVRTVIQAGYRFAWEKYFPEPPTESQAQQVLETKLTAEMQSWQEALPGCAGNLVLCFGYMSIPITETLNLNPEVDYKVWMDMQFHEAATDPAFEGLYGLMEYTSGYADEETVRWAAKLYRHYGIDGATELLSRKYGYQYHPDLLKNPDFADGTDFWTVEPAESGSAEARVMKGLGWLEGRYPRTSMGDTFLWTRRSEHKPNTFSQLIRNLRPGQLYSLKMITADFQELSCGQSAQQKHAVSITLDSVQPVEEKSFQHPVANNYAHELGAFTGPNKAWMNYHYQVFRAKARTAKLAISDWTSSIKPGGPAGQQLMFNFIEVQPYLAE